MSLGPQIKKIYTVERTISVTMQEGRRVAGAGDLEDGILGHMNDLFRAFTAWL